MLTKSTEPTAWVGSRKTLNPGACYTWLDLSLRRARSQHLTVLLVERAGSVGSVTAGGARGMCFPSTRHAHATSHPISPASHPSVPCSSCIFDGTPRNLPGNRSIRNCTSPNGKFQSPHHFVFRMIWTHHCSRLQSQVYKVYSHFSVLTGSAFSRLALRRVSFDGVLKC